MQGANSSLNMEVTAEVIYSLPDKRSAQESSPGDTLARRPGQLLKLRRRHSTSDTLDKLVGSAMLALRLPLNTSSWSVGVLACEIFAVI